MGRSTDTRNPEPFELVGTKDLRESFKDGQRIRGSFSINGVEMHQFDANTPASVVTQINAKTDQHYLTAEIDDGGHLVLVDRSGAEPVIRMGAPWQDAPPVSSGDAVKDFIAAQKAIRDEEKGEKRGNVLEQLGLADAGNDREQDGNIEPGFETGLSAEERKERYKQERFYRDMPRTAEGTPIYPSRPASGPLGTSNLKLPPGQGLPSNPSPGATGSQGDMPSGEHRTGTGGGSGETAAATIQKTHSEPGSQPPAQ
jgi:hypothetical protein